MAITRAQQYRQMLKEGSMKPVMQGGVKNYLGEQETVSNVPVKWQSGPDKPATELAYITKAEKNLLLKKDLHGSLKDGPNTGPEGLISLDSQGSGFGGPGPGRGGTGPGPQGDFKSNAQHTGLKGDYSKDRTVRGDTSAFTDKGTGDYTVSDRPEDLQAVLDYSQGLLGFQKGKKPGFFTGPGSLKARHQIYNLQQTINALDRYNNTRKNKVMSGLKQLGINPSYDEEDETFEDLVNNAPSITGMTDKFSQKTINDVLAGNRQIDFFSPIDPNIAPGLATKGLVSLANIVGPKLSGPVTQEKLNSLLGEIDTLKNIDPRETTTKDLMETFAPNQYEMVYGNDEGEGKGGRDPYVPSTIPFQTAVAEPVEEEDEIVNYRLMADGGMTNDAPVYEGGIMDLESSRQMYGLGKLVKKVTRSVKKIAKSPIGKAALGYALTGGLSNMAAGRSFGANFFSPSSFISKGGIKNIFTKGGAKNILFGGQKLSGLASKNNFVDFSGILGSGGKASLAKMIGIPTALSYFMTPEEEEEQKLASYGADIDDPSYIINNPFKYTNPRLMAEGGSTEEPVAKKTMPLLDMDGQEMDLREEGGFVPLGRMERADDVPARLSKNEFVFTADAVRNAGEGDVDKGAEVMYNMMKNLESGGEVSEESQGLEGARDMFQTSQRLEEVI